MKKLLLLFVTMTVSLSSRADEGMWMINSFDEVIYNQMRKNGLKLKASEIYNESDPALFNAIVAINGGMGTGSMISDRGLMITNHHVAYRDIYSISTPDNNYLKNGFWAAGLPDEIPAKGTTVTFLRKVVDITDEAKKLRQEMIDNNDWNFMGARKLYGSLEKRYESSTPWEPSCKSFFNGEIYLMFFCETYKDVRLAGFPPESIGSFGGETDNWGWPQHKGDFALYRVYGDKDGKPAEYSPENVPLKPVKSLKISTSGVKEGDFTMIIGFPGSVDRYMSSFAVTEKERVENPVTATMRRAGLEAMREHMDADPKIRLAYSNIYMSAGNYTDYAKWETICLRRCGVSGIKAEEEARMQKWIDADTARKNKYGTLLADLGRGYSARAKAVREKLYHKETWFGLCQSTIQGFRLGYLPVWMERNGVDSLDISSERVADYLGYYSDAFDPDTEKDIFARLIEGYIRNVPAEAWGEVLTRLHDKFGNDGEAIAEYVFTNSFITSPERYKQFFSVKRGKADISSDVMVALAESSDNKYFDNVQKEAEDRAGVDVNEREYDYQKLLYSFRMQEGVKQYPNANSTMRITYGSVGGIQPGDAVYYDYISTAAGILEKYDPENFDFNVDDRMLSLIKSGDWGRWGTKGKLYIDFLSNNDITGGNSGSPILNAEGKVIGLCFDGNRESMAGNVYFHPVLNKCVNVDIRYVLWVIDKYAGASSLIDEMAPTE